MNNDGWGFLGAGTSDNRLAGEDLQHARQKRTADEEMSGIPRMVRHSAEDGGPMKHDLYKEEKERHEEARKMRLEHLENHYKR